MATPLLVIGYGNALRGDDGAGPCAALRVGARREGGRWGGALRTLAVHQLLPELVDDIAGAGRVVFIDAYAADEANEANEADEMNAANEAAPLRIDAVEAVEVGEVGDAVEGRAEAGWPAGLRAAHASSPAALLTLCARLYASVPPAWVVGIPAYDFTPGAAISPRTARRIEEAVDFCVVQGERR